MMRRLPEGMQKMTPQEIRAAAVQAAASVTGPGGFPDEVFRAADAIAAYIARGASLAPPEEEEEAVNPAVQAIAGMAALCDRREDIEFLQKMADRMHCLESVVPLDDMYVPVNDCLRHHWKALSYKNL